MTRTSLHTAKNTDKVRWRDHSNFFPNPPTDGTFVLITPKYVAKKKERKKKVLLIFHGTIEQTSAF